MAAFFDILLLVILGYAVWLLRMYVRETIEFRIAKRAEIKRRLQVEHKNELALEQQLKTADDTEALKLELEFARERSRRQISYVIQDVFERTK